MAGSRKGEKRGAAGSPASKARGGAVSTPKPPRIRVHHQQVKKEEYYRDIQRVIHGGEADDIEPREMLLEAMRYFHGQAGEAKSHKQWILSKLSECKNDADFERIDRELGAADVRIRDAYLLAVDCGFKVAPYMHAKMSSVEISGPDKGPIEIMNILLQEITINTAERPSWAQESDMVIDHEE